MNEKRLIHDSYRFLEKELHEKIYSFSTSGAIIMNGERNIIKKFNLSNEIQISIKSFKKPHLVNQFAYQYIRPSKAKRSYHYAMRLKKSNILTPSPIAYFEFSNFLGIINSYYISSYINYDFTYRALLDKKFPDRENILRQFTRFTHKLHQNNIEFLDHSPGNTLIIKKDNNRYDFYLIDLNRMRFKKLNFEERIGNFRKLSAKEDMLYIMSDEYAKITKSPFDKTYELMKNANNNFQRKYQRRLQFKAKYLPRKNKPI